jgi:membrane glycosyltransferase
VLQGIFLVLCALSFAWIALGTSSALLGFIDVLAASRSAMRVDLGGGASSAQTALLFPVYQEDTARIAATIEAIAQELIALGVAEKFSIFVLSDSRAGDMKARELRAVRFLHRRLQGRIHVYYRARADNIGKKAGNIADWVRRFGAAYQSFIILDADSIMSGALLSQLQVAMAEDPKVGLLQTVPRLVGAQTLFARLQQFAVAFYGPVIAAGFAAWHQTSGNYWGHNAIVRTCAFAEACGLPDLRGRPPLGGHVQSHDFVEAAFLRRAGWDIRMLPHLDGSYEGCPPTLIDVAVRDRRWAQGNLQHLRIIGASGLPWVSRLHLAMGIYSYLASALWALSLLVGVVLSFQSAFTLPTYFPDQKTLFPVWPVIDPTKAFYLFLGTIAIVLLPKVLGIVLAFLRPHNGARLSPARFLGGALIEMLFSILVAPILMLTQTTAVIEILSGKDSGWSAQRRDGDAPELGQLLRFHLWHEVLGVVLAVTCALISLYVFAWMSPIILGLLLAVGFSYVTSRQASTWIAGALATSEDLQPPAIVAAVERGYAEWATLVAKRQVESPNLLRRDQSSRP